MKLGLVLHQLPPRHNTGTELFALRVAKSLVERGHEVSVFAAEPCFDDTARFEEEERVLDGIRCRVVLASTALHRNAVLAEYDSPFFAALFTDWLLGERPDLVHVFHAQSVGVGVVRACASLGVPCSVSFLDFWAFCPRATLIEHGARECAGPESVKRCAACLATLPAFAPTAALAADARADEPFARAPLATRATDDDAARWDAARARPANAQQVFESASAMVLTSHSLARRYAAAGYDASRMTVIPLGARDDLVRRGPASLRASSGRVEIAYLGGFVKHKGLELLLDAFCALDWPAARLSICGDPSVDPAVAERAHARAAGDPRIAWVGVVRSTELDAFLARMDVVVVPSLWTENTPFVVLEAQAAGLPVVVPRTAGFVEVAHEEQDALCFALGDVNELGRALARLRDESGLLAQLASGVREPQRHKGIVDAMVALWERTLAATGRAWRDTSDVRALAERALRENAELRRDAARRATLLGPVLIKAGRAERSTLVFRPLRFLVKHWRLARGVPEPSTDEERNIRATRI